VNEADALVACKGANSDVFEGVSLVRGNSRRVSPVKISKGHMMELSIFRAYFHGHATSIMALIEYALTSNETFLVAATFGE
jgi:L-aminopeptidase/D-esterase-like protein